MRWRSSGGGESTAAIEEETDSHPCESTTASSSSTASYSPINDEPDSTSSSSALIPAGAIPSHSQQPQNSSSAQLVSPDIVLGSAADPGDPGDPPYNSPLTPSHSSQQQVEEEDDDGGEEGLEESSSSQTNSKEPQKPAAAEDDEGTDQEIPWKPQATQSTCEFTHTITNYSQKRDSGCKKAEYSSTTIDEFGNRWRLIVYVNGNGRASNHHLSLFLQVADADDLPFGWKKAVSYVLTLEHPSGPNLSYAKRNPDKTFKLCPKAIDWGWSQFITSDRIQQEGFVQNDSLVVRASVTVKSSSVCIDLEDAELYLKCAVEEGKPDAVQLCLDQGASVNCQFKDDLYTPLHTACSSSTAEDANDANPNNNNLGSMQVLQLLLEKGADGNACNKWRETPLLIAANNGHRSAVEALLKHGADPSLCSEAGWSALTFAAHKGYDDIVALLLRAGAPVNCRVTEDSSTPLHKACAGSKPGHLTAVKLLLENGADVHALNKWRETPLLTAANHGQAGAVEALLRAGADPCKCTDTGWSPLSIAAYKGHDDVVRLLLEEGAPTEEADPTLSALLQAATKGLPGTVELLLRHGADHTVTTKKGDTALSILVEQNLIDAAVEMVTEYKASVPRCSRDRKKVQRARLLINLRVKQQQREGLNVYG
jgi:ankyrin repeat protein